MRLPFKATLLLRLLLLSSIVSIASSTARPQEQNLNPSFPRALTADDYARAERLMGIACRASQFDAAGDWTDVQWGPDSAQVSSVSTSRGHKQETFRVADAATGVVRDVIQERVATQYESGQGAANWRTLAGSNEFIWARRQRAALQRAAGSERAYQVQ